MKLLKGDGLDKFRFRHVAIAATEAAASIDSYGPKNIREAFLHGAEWQRGKDSMYIYDNFGQDAAGEFWNESHDCTGEESCKPGEQCFGYKRGIE